MKTEMNIENNKALRCRFKAETNGEYEDKAEFTFPTWQYVFWLENKIISQATSDKTDHMSPKQEGS